VRLVPQSLFGRLVGALLAVVAVAVLVIVVLLARDRREAVFWGGSSNELIEFLASTTEELAALPAGDRRARMLELRREALPFAEAGDRRPRRPPAFDDIAAARSYEKRLQRELGPGFAVDVRPARHGRRGIIRIRDGRAIMSVGGPPGGPPPPGGPGGKPHELDVSVRLPDGGLVAYRVPSPRAGPPLPTRIFVELALLTTVLAGVLYLMARSITRPLAALAGAADAMSRGESPGPLPESGASELREATRAFNAMHERLERYLESRTQLVAGMSHDLRTPLTRLRLRAERFADPDLRERIVADVEEMTAMIRGTLDMLRGMNDDEPRVTIDIMAFVEELAGEYHEMGADVRVAGHAGAPLDVKPQALKRCLVNLIDNALKYGECATVLVSDGDELVIRVSDEGPGIPPESLEKVFQPFFRLDASRNPATGGTGLGLSIARDIAQAHGGTLVLENRVPRGLDAVLSLPRGAKA
jgi:signal transduction histidine kinase